MPVIDEEGRLFGVVNVIDAMAVVFVLALVVAGVSLVSAGDETATHEVTVRTTVPPWHADAITIGPVPDGGSVEAVVNIEHVATYEVGFNASHPNQATTYVRLDVTLHVVGGETRWRVGEDVSVDLPRVVLNGVIVSVERSSD